MYHLHVYTSSQRIMRFMQNSFSQKYENWNYHLGRAPGRCRMLNKYFQQSAEVWGPCSSSWIYEDVIRNFVMIYKATLGTINKGSRVINIENSDNGQMSDSPSFFAPMLFICFSVMCVPLSINERNLIIQCSVWLFTYLHVHHPAAPSVYGRVFVGGQPRVGKHDNISVSRLSVHVTWR